MGNSPGLCSLFASPLRPTTPALPTSAEVQPGAPLHRGPLEDGNSYLRSLLYQLGVSAPLSSPARCALPSVGSPAAASAAGEGGSCVVCWEGAKDVVLLPCKHMALCMGCARSMLGRSAPQQARCCPMCRGEVSVMGGGGRLGSGGALQGSAVVEAELLAAWLGLQLCGVCGAVVSGSIGAHFCRLPPPSVDTYG